MTESVDLGLNVFDHQLLDSEDRRCGKVDDLALEGGPGEALEVVAILCGPGVWRGRAGVLGRIAAWLGGGLVYGLFGGLFGGPPATGLIGVLFGGPATGLIGMRLANSRSAV